MSYNSELQNNNNELRAILGMVNELLKFKNKWNLLDRIEYVGQIEDATYYFNAEDSSAVMPLSESVWLNGGIHFNNGSYYNRDITIRQCTLSNITENSFTLTACSGGTDSFVSFPFHLNAGETIKITHTSDGTNRSGYQIFNVNGTIRDYVTKFSSNSPGIDVTEYTATDECWFAWICGRYDAGTSMTISNIVVTIE